MDKNTLLQVWPIPAFDDNYIWCIHNGKSALVVDPGDAVPVLEYLKQSGLRLTGILITHHHADHTGGILALLDALGKDIPVIGPAGSNIPGRTQIAKADDKIEITSPRISLQVYEVPGHTLSHIAYFANMQANVVEPMLFCGDTLFASGCGRLFEGTPTQMTQSLAKFASLPKNTLVYCTHEYTLSNIRFALAVEPNNVNLISWDEQARALRDQGLPTLPTTVGQELQVNPFMRCDQAEVIAAAKEISNHADLSTPAHVLAVIRAWKDRF
ncbi:hydroxyacylglutathione hydrolase [Polynucleobacter asymbioticus]|jgi:hydroxyacylglutathione hydrolase|uniref:Hydroxyacylglutathione hydrolase n=2 Tax=Polynucleobacter asymbioticus TaxID=576611 RepID=A4SXM4_POLAQ|nr:hydroxyacylglutathione hydrolase [Polynucleobacter asymbioticus]ABP34238.1 Hydroxyacylglutathione hydrolase [Polynucleobacter asymbioticus QLW-P1DMWA-1]APB98893.1 hydroxyacylglutathione hydrolase [Polynucleobacter asymbioticus]APC01195.1 hydroxyacylglutathione hydrolase [Polynucleobacter asymbioticus]APC06074.1 hydroxyacylglutathione hydrolase [Polynucleobacter asymbioticus]